MVLFKTIVKSSKGKGNYTRKKKLVPEQMSREELIEYVKAVEDIKINCLPKTPKEKYQIIDILKVNIILIYYV